MATERLNEQIKILRSLVSKAKNIDVSALSPEGDPSPCQAVWRVMPGVKVPTPNEVAVTEGEKRTLYQKLKQMAKSSRDQHLSVDTEKNTRKSEEAFKYAWRPGGRFLVNLDDASFPSSEMLFLPKNEASGVVAYFAHILLDRDDSGLSLEMSVIGRDGLTQVSGTGMATESAEYFWARDHEPPFGLPHDYAGLLESSGNVSLWYLKKLQGGHWLLVFGPVIDAKSGRSVDCMVTFNE